MTSEQFDALPAAKRRVLIAQDILAYLSAGHLRVATGDYMHGESRGFAPCDASAKDHMPEVLGACQVCAKGAMYLAHIGRSNRATVADVLDSGCDDMRHRLVEDDQVFEIDQWDLIECAFERALFGVYEEADNVGDDTLAKLGEVAICFGKRFRRGRSGYDCDYDAARAADRRRLTAIMLNIIANKGTFKPTELKSSSGAKVTAALKPPKVLGHGAGVTKYLVVGYYSDQRQRWSETFEAENPIEAEEQAPCNVNVCAVIQVVDGVAVIVDNEFEVLPGKAEPT